MSRTLCSVQRCCAEPGPGKPHCPLQHGPLLCSALSKRRCAASGARDLLKEKGRSVSQAAFPVLRRLHIPSGDFGTSRPGAYLPIESWSAAAAFRDSRELLPEPNAMVSHLRKMGSLSRIARIGATPEQAQSPLFPLSTAAGCGCGCIQSSGERSPAASQASRAGSRRSPWDACRWRAWSRRGGRPSRCRSGSAGAAFPTRAAGS